MARRRGIISYGAYVPRARLDRAEVAAVAGGGGGSGTRSVASYDEDTTTMAVAAARGCDLEPLARTGLDNLWFATTTPAYLDKANATAIHAALRLDSSVAAFDALGSVRSTMGGLRAGLGSAGRALVVAADVRTGRPGSADEAAGGDGAAALLVGEEHDEAPFPAEVVGWGGATAEFLDRWRTPGEQHSHTWEERFGEGHYVALGQRAWEDGLAAAGLSSNQVDRVVVVGSHARACASLSRKLGLGDKTSSDSAQLLGEVGFTGAAQPLLALAAQLDVAEPGEVIAMVVLADGADVVLWRTTADVTEHRQPKPVADQVAAGLPISYGRYLAWRGWLAVEPPRRPEPARPSAAAAGRSADWKFGFVGSVADDGTVHLPPEPGDVTARPMADAPGTVVTFTIDRMAYSASPPVVFAVVDFDGGGRLPVELTDVDADDVQVGDRVEMTFRKLFTAEGIHNYFWKARPLMTQAEPAPSGARTSQGEA